MIATATAASVIARSEVPVTTRSGQRGIPSELFTANVQLGGIDFEYIFQGHHHDADAPAIGRIRRLAPNEFRAVSVAGTVTAESADRETAIRSLI